MSVEGTIGEAPPPTECTCYKHFTFDGGPGWCELHGRRREMMIAPRDNGWGHHISWFDFKKGRIWGHLPRSKMKESERFGFQMQSGRVAVFRAVNVKWESNPPDMFWADAKFIGYEDELEAKQAVG